MMRTVLIFTAVFLGSIAQAGASSGKGKSSLYVRLGQKPGVARISHEFVKGLTGDPRLLNNPKIKEAADRADKKKVEARLTEHLCRASGGPCKPKGKILENAPKDMKLNASEWLSVIQDAEQALDRAKVKDNERQELLQILFQYQG
jgi:hemoglobin